MAMNERDLKSPFEDFVFLRDMTLGMVGVVGVLIVVGVVGVVGEAVCLREKIDEPSLLALSALRSGSRHSLYVFAVVVAGMRKCGVAPFGLYFSSSS